MSQHTTQKRTVIRATFGPTVGGITLLVYVTYSYAGRRLKKGICRVYNVMFTATTLSTSEIAEKSHFHPVRISKFSEIGGCAAEEINSARPENRP